MFKGLYLDQFKEPAFSSEILNIDVPRIYIKSSYKNASNNDFKFLFSQEDQLNKGMIIATKSIGNHDKHVNFYSHSDYIVKEPAYLVDESLKASYFVTLESINTDFIKPMICNSEKGNHYEEDKRFQNISKRISFDELINVAYCSSIIDETDNIYLFEKLKQIKKNNKNNIKIYIDAIDDQPYTSSKESLIINYPNAINFVTYTLKNTLMINDIDLLFYDVERYNREIKIPKESINNIVKGIKINYPIRYFLNKKFDYVESLGIQACIHLARALMDNNYSQTTTFLTVSGDVIVSPRNVEVPIGSLVEDIIGCFEKTCDPIRIIIGQVITGKSISNYQIPISAITRSILLFSDYELIKPTECIGCSRCSNVCPRNLLPAYRSKFIKTQEPILKAFSDESLCIKCYCCNYICPSKINLV